ncbi:uncharacterized protein LOC117644541 [Thrips palmi]|uniref:Uncharacterized protein LOC117644541 n=1 Tax=Thrips palmi TaxID=161013 RepID=A0A6P8YSF5_THRPL|nr:uncharacterized protein LOC117644541 [Thrips palmi]
MALSTVALVLLVSAIGASTATSSNGVQWKPRPRMEYEFELNGRSLAGLPALQGQYSGVQYAGRVRVQGLTADTAIIRLEKMSWSALHARMQSGWWSAEPQGNATLSGHGHMASMPMPLSGSSAVARFHDGQVQTVLVSREARDWEVNLLQGVLGHMQIQAGSSGNSLHGKEQHSEQGVYRVLENGVSGRCMVQYEVSPTNAPAEASAAEAKMCAGKPYVQITKTKNFTDCEQYAEQSRGLPRCSPAGNSCASLWARNTLTQLVGCGAGADLQLVQAVSSSSMQAELQTREESRAVVHSSVNMTLVRAQPVRERLATPKDGVVLNGLGYRVGGKQVNGAYGLDSDYSDSSEEGDDSVEVIRHPQQQNQAASSESSSSDSDDTSESASAAQKHKKASSHKKNSNDQQNHKSQKHKNQQDSSSSEEDNNSAKHNSRKYKNQQDSSASDSSSSSEEDNASAKHNSRKHKNQKASSSEEDSNSDNNAKHHSRKHKNQQDSSEENSNNYNAKHNSRKHKSQQDSSSEENNNSDNNSDNNAKQNSRKHKNQQASSSEESAKHMNGRLSRKPRSAKSNNNKQGSDEAAVEDVFAGVLSPAAVQQNATLRAALQKRVAEEVNKAGAELRRQDGPAPRTMERVSMAIRVARALSADQLRAVRDQLHAQEAKELFRDILAMCGSTACVQETVAMIKDRKMSAVAAQMALASLADRVSVPTRNILKHVQDLYQSSSDQQVKIAAALAVGNLAGRASRSVAASAADFLGEQLAAASQASKGSKAALRAPLAAALGSTGTPQAAQALIKVAKNAKNAPYQRAQAILALRASASRAPAVVRDALLALFHDPTEPAPVRMAAVSLLVYLRPSLPLWQRLAISTFYEPNMAVCSYVWATIHSFAQLQDPAFRQQTQFARLALPLTRRSPQGAHLAFNVVAASVDAHLDRMVHEHVSMMAPADAANAYYRRVARRSGVSSLDQEVDMWGANPDELLQAAMDAVFGRQDKASARPVVDNKAVPAFHATRTIHDKLSIVRRRLQDPQGHLRLTLKPFVNNLFVPFDKDTPSQIAKAAGSLMDKLRSETRFHAQQMGGEELSMAAVTEMGFPVNFRIQAPWLVRAEGSAQVHRNHSANANITCIYTSGLSAQLSVQPSWTTREYLAAVNGHALIQLPATAVSAQMNATDGRVSVRVEPGHDAGSTVLARIATQPLTSALDLSRGELATESGAAHNASRDAPTAPMAAQTVELSPWEDVSLSLRAPVDKAALVAWLQDSRTVLGFPVLGRPLSASRIELVAARPRAVNVSLALVKGVMQSGDLQVVYPASLRPSDAAPAQPEYPSTTTEYPSTSTTTPAPTTTSTTEYPSTTTAAPAVVRTPRASNGAHGSRGKNGSLYEDDGEVDFTRSLFNATTLNPYSNRVNGSNELYVLSQVLGGMSGGRGYVVGVNVSAEAAADKTASSYSAFWTFGANLGGRLVRTGLFGRSDADNAQVAATGAVLKDVPARADLHAALRQLPAVMVKAEYVQVDASAAKKVVTAVMETDRSAAQSRRLQQAALEQYCVPKDASHAKNASVAVSRACREVLGAANTPDQFNVTLNYNSAADESWGGAVHGALQAARAYLWNQGNIMVDTLAAGNNNELGGGITVQADGTLNGWLQTPRTLTRMAGAKAPVAGTLIQAAHKETGDFCGVSATRLVTLDGAMGDMKLGDCWHVLAKDCSGKSRVAVLAKADKGKAEHMEVEINIDNYQIARLFPDGSATLNGQAVFNSSDNAGAAVAVRDADDVDVLQMVRGEDGAVNVKLADHGMSLVYGNSSVVIQAGASLRGRLCGMCGNFDASAAGDMLNPKNKAEKTVQAFADSYAIKDAQCSKGRQ